jgi:phospholipid/cholesterol/gamma-HCH transport system substrate-binding protein
MALIRRKNDPHATGIAPFKAGMIAIVIVAIAVFFGFSRYNPFHHPFELKAAMQSANNLKPRAPVRVAGVTVGQVKKIEPIKGGKGAMVTMEIEKSGLPIKKDAVLKVRPRIFLEGNFFVDINPGTPSAENYKSGATVPIQNTATPVQFGQLLTALQSDTRQDLQTFLYEYAQKGIGNGGAEAYKQGLKDAPGALRTSSIANDATLGQKPHDLSNLERGQQRLAKSLTTNPFALRDLITQLNVTFGALAREDTALEASIPALNDTLRVGVPALRSLDAALPSLRAFARDALPGTRSSGPTLDASLPFITQLRLLARKQELRGLVHDLRPTIPALAKLNRGSIGLLNENRALSACQNNVLLPWVQKGVPDPEEPEIDGQPFYKSSAHGLVGLSSESRMNDANSPFVHIQAGSGPTNILYTHNGSNFIATAPGPPEGIRPAKSTRPSFRPGEPCELQEVPDLNAPSGAPDPFKTVTDPGGLLPPLPQNVGLAKRGAAQINQVKDYLVRRKKGQDTPDPLTTPRPVYLLKMKKLGLQVLPSGKVVKRKKAGR